MFPGHRPDNLPYLIQSPELSQIVLPGKLTNIAVKMLRTDLVENSIMSPLEHGPETLHAIGMGRFDGGEITSDGGSVLLREVEQRNRILGRLSDCFSPYRCLYEPLRLLPAGATVAGRVSHPLGESAFPRRTEISGLDLGGAEVGVASQILDVLKRYVLAEQVRDFEDPK